MIQALPRIAEANPREGYLMEALMAAITQGTDDAKLRMRDFLDGRLAGDGDRAAVLALAETFLADLRDA